MKDFFVSYNKADRQWAEWIAWQLETVGFSTIIQAWDFGAGSDFVEEMNRATNNAERLIAVLSETYLQSEFCAAEWHAAFADDPTGKQRKLLPVRVRECNPDGLLKVRNYIDLVGKDEVEAKELLLAMLKGERAKPSQPVPFPAAAATAKPRFPGAWPSIWNVPHQPNPHFVGRTALLDQMQQTLATQHAAALTAIHGLGGVGKTQLATEFAYQHAYEYDLVWWLRAEETATLTNDLAALAVPLNLPEKDTRETDVIVAAVLRWLTQHHSWLLIYDNARGAEELRALLPKHRAGHMLITSRNPVWGNLASKLEVTTLPPADAVKFLLERTGQTDAAAAEKLAEELGYLPLALEQAAAYIEASQETLTGYLELFRTRRRELWADEPAPPDHDDGTVATTWLISFAEAQQQCPVAADLLRLCAFLAPDNIPLDVLCAGAEHLPESLAQTLTDQVACNKAIAALRRYSLIEKKDDNLSLHRLVQTVTRDQMSEDEQKLWAEVAVNIIDDAFPIECDDARTWNFCDRLLSHALVAVEKSEALNVAIEATGHLFNLTVVYFLSRAQFAAAFRSLTQALKIAEAIFTPNHQNIASTLNNIGMVLQALHQLEEARHHLERALLISEAVYGINHPGVAVEIGNLGLILKKLGRLEESLVFAERAIQILETIYDRDHSSLATPLNNLGEALRTLKRFDEAQMYIERALRIDEATYGIDHPDIARDKNNLGLVLQAIGKPEEARKCFEHALHICIGFLGTDHPNTILVRNNLKSLG